MSVATFENEVREVVEGAASTDEAEVLLGWQYPLLKGIFNIDQRGPTLRRVLIRRDGDPSNEAVRIFCRT